MTTSLASCLCLGGTAIPPHDAMESAAALSMPARQTASLALCGGMATRMCRRRGVPVDSRSAAALFKMAVKLPEPPRLASLRTRVTSVVLRDLLDEVCMGDSRAWQPCRSREVNSLTEPPERTAALPPLSSANEARSLLCSVLSKTAPLNAAAAADWTGAQQSIVAMSWQAEGTRCVAATEVCRGGSVDELARASPATTAAAGLPRSHDMHAAAVRDAVQLTQDQFWTAESTLVGSLPEGGSLACASSCESGRGDPGNAGDAAAEEPGGGAIITCSIRAGAACLWFAQQSHHSPHLPTIMGAGSYELEGSFSSQL